ncbi:MAG: AbrB/MazE/SpoVT family DNA-binding domain-containing protein [Gammaproteobacteria bacterium]|nr:AbrB/MazE/SpoVT family DNA-binding domain-containing protein [Gammaproteobacteria bacterium]
MRVTTKGQVTIPLAIRKALGIKPYSQVEFIQEDGRAYLRPVQKRPSREEYARRLRAVSGSATVRMSTDAILAMTRGED